VVDIRDFTALSRAVSEALLSQTIGTWFLEVGQAAERRGSWAQQYIGDAVMAVWVHEDASRIGNDVIQVLHALCEIFRSTAEVSHSLPLPNPLRIGAGISTGPGILGGTDYTALGDTVNAAFRLEDATKTIGLGVALGQRAFEALDERQRALFERNEVHLKCYKTPSTAWAISFDDLMEHFFRQSRGA
jgi:adenylate cyclase